MTVGERLMLDQEIDGPNTLVYPVSHLEVCGFAQAAGGAPNLIAALLGIIERPAIRGHIAGVLLRAARKTMMAVVVADEV